MNSTITLWPLSPVPLADLSCTGTPAGVGKVEQGDRLEGAVEGAGTLFLTIV